MIPFDVIDGKKCMGRPQKVREWIGSRVIGSGECILIIYLYSIVIETVISSGVSYFFRLI